MATWVEQTITIATTWGPQEIDALVCGPFAIHAHPFAHAQRVVLTHLPTGQAMGERCLAGTDNLKYVLRLHAAFLEAHPVDWWRGLTAENALEFFPEFKRLHHAVEAALAV